jgi:hypothetical protein
MVTVTTELKAWAFITDRPRGAFDNSIMAIAGAVVSYVPGTLIKPPVKNELG